MQMQTRTPRRPKTFRLSDAEFAAIREAAADAGLPWTTFVRRAATTAARQAITPPVLTMDSGRSVALTETSEDK